MAATVAASAAVVDCDTATVILQAFNHSVYMVGGPAVKKGFQKKHS
jgi:hypothetical protein